MRDDLPKLLQSGALDDLVRAGHLLESDQATSAAAIEQALGVLASFSRAEGVVGDSEIQAYCCLLRGVLVNARSLSASNRHRLADCLKDWISSEHTKLRRSAIVWIGACCDDSALAADLLNPLLARSDKIDASFPYTFRGEAARALLKVDRDLVRGVHSLDALHDARDVIVAATTGESRSSRGLVGELQIIDSLIEDRSR